MILRALTLTGLLFVVATRPAAAQAKPASTPPPEVEPTDVMAPSVVPNGSTNETSESRARIEARDRFTAGLKLYEEGEFALALIEFERAYSLVPDHRVLFNIGQVSIQLGRYAHAVRTLRQYLSDGGDRVPIDRQQSVSNDLNMLAARTATIQIAVDVPGAEIVLDNDIVATAPMSSPLLVDAGEHRLTIRKAGHIAQIRPIALAGRDALNLSIELLPEPKVVATEKTVIVERKEPHQAADVDHRSLNLWLGWSGTALLGASWATAGAFGLGAAKDREDALSTKTSAKELDRLETKTRRWYLASDCLGGATLLSAGAMLYYTLTSRPRPSRHAAAAPQSAWSLNVGPQQVWVSGHF